MAETNVTEPKTAAIKKTDDSILGACCYKLKRFWKAHKIVYLKVFGTITLCKTEKRQTSKHKKADQTTQKRKEQLDVIKNICLKNISITRCRFPRNWFSESKLFSNSLKIHSA